MFDKWHTLTLMLYTAPSSAAISFVPVFSNTTPGRLATALAAISHIDPFVQALGMVPPISAVLPPGDVSTMGVAIPGWAAVPPRLAKKILSLEFVDMCDSCQNPGAWCQAKGAAATPAAPVAAW